MPRRPVELVSGVWQGFYAQHGRRHPQHMTLEFADGLVRGDGIDGIAAFTIEGEYRVDQGEVRMGWIKTYERAHSVLYLGELHGAVIRGEWRLAGGRGGFALEPARGPAADAIEVPR
jgi:hypothetical protein